MNAMLRTRHTAVLSLAFAMVTLLPGSGAQAQWYSSVSQPPPLYPYAVQNSAIRADRPYAVEVAPGTYVIQRPLSSHAEPPKRSRGASVPSAPVRERRHGKTDPALIEELRKRPKVRRAVVNTTRIVHDEPVVIETRRYVDDPPRVVERYRVVEDKRPDHRKEPVVVKGRGGDSKTSAGKRAGKNNDKHGEKHGGDEKRVIAAEAEITILGPDRMNIRLFRKGGGRKANASAD